MIRFINLGEQILGGTPMFAWYDTLSGTFEMFNASESWKTWKEFKEDHAVEEEYIVEKCFYRKQPISHYKLLFPVKWKELKSGK